MKPLPIQTLLLALAFAPAAYSQLPSYPPTGVITSTVKGSIDLAGSEIPAFDPISKRAFAGSGTGIQVVDLTDPAAPAFVTNIQPSTLGISGLTSNDISSVAVRKGTGGNPSILAAAIINSPKTANGHVVFLNAATGALLGSTTVGAVPDHIAFTPDGSKLLVCNEGEIAGDEDALVSAEMVPGSVSIIDLTNLASPTVQTAGFASFNGQAAALKAAGVRIFDGGTPEFDFEPEYLAVSPDGTKAMVTLQEANAVGILDIASASFTSVVPLGEKDFSTLYADFGDRDGPSNSQLMNLTTGNPVFGLYMPDAIASYQVNGQTYYITSNEGDDRDDFLATPETIRVGNSGYVLDPTVFPNATTLKTSARLGRLTVSNAPGLRGDTDITPDGDVDRILTYGGRSFSILDSNGAQVFDSGDMIEVIVASQFPAQFDDTRSDNKGPEPEGVTVAKIGARTFAFIGLERSGMTLAFDVTNPLAPTYATAFQRTGDFRPEGLTVVEAADSPSGKPLLIVGNEGSTDPVLQPSLTIFEINDTVDFELQVLHASDLEGGVGAIPNAPAFGAVVDALEADAAQSDIGSILLSAGDNYIPGPFFNASANSSFAPLFNAAYNTLFGVTTYNDLRAEAGRVDITIMNILGFDASAVGNHEFDDTSAGMELIIEEDFRGAAGPASDRWVGAQFPYLSANLNFSGDSALSDLHTSSILPNTSFLTGPAESQANNNTVKKLAPATTISVNGELIGVVGATTQLLSSISSPSGTVGTAGLVNNMPALAAVLQPVIDDLKNGVDNIPGNTDDVDKIILVSHLQQFALEQALAPLLSGVDVIIAGGSDTLLADSTDHLRSGDTATGTYPFLGTNLDGDPVAIVSTAGEYSYVGRLVVGFNATGVLLPATINAAVSGAYATDETGVIATTGAASLAAAVTASTKATEIKKLTDNVTDIIEDKDSEVKGYTDVYIEGRRSLVRTQETTLGNLTADANLVRARLVDPAVSVSIKNGGGVRASIGAIDGLTGALLPPLANPTAPKPAGAVSQLDIENTLRFNNQLTILTLTASGLKQIIEHGVAPWTTTATEGRFPQVGGMKFSFDPALAAGSRVRSMVILNDDGSVKDCIVAGGNLVGDSTREIKIVTLNFLANPSSGNPAVGGDSYPFPTLAVGGTAAYNSTTIGEQAAFAELLTAEYPLPASAFDVAETPATLDLRIQNLSLRSDNALDGAPNTFECWLALNSYSSSGFNADSDNDGVEDGVEFFFNQNPNNGGDLGNLPKLLPVAGAQQLSFTRLTDPDSTTGKLLVSSDLSTWTAAISGLDFSLASSVENGGETTITYALPGSGPSAPGTSATYPTPNSSDPVGATLGGVRVVNEGLVGVGRLSGNSLDSFGETQGAASGLFITDWAYNAGQFSGTFQVLPDRGHGDGTSNYAARLHEVDFTFTPYYGEIAAGAQNQVVPTYANSTKFTYLDGATPKFTTGLNPTGTSTLFGQTVGTVTAANGPGGAQATLLSMDAEAIHLFDDGSGYISDEYGTYIARFNSAKKITGLTQLPGAAQPYKTGVLNFDSAAAPNTGRRNNQGLEGMSVTPDGTRLFALLQSATVQDSGSTADKRNNARLFVYDIVGANRENPVLVGEYVVKLPQIDLDSITAPSALNGTAAQSEIVALGNSSFLMLPRDGNGLGKLNSAPILFKSVQLVEFASATNILGQYDGIVQKIIGLDGLLLPEIKAAASAEVINLLHQDDLTKFRLNKDIPANANTLNEKIEGMSLVPDLSTTTANDFFLFVANDNDFQSSNVMMLDAAGNVTTKGNGQVGGITNDAMFYVWRLTIDAGGKKFFRMAVEN